MKNINLKNENLKNKKKGAGNLSTILSSVLILTLLIAYGTIFFLNDFTKKQTEKIQNEIETLQKTLSQDEYQEVYKFGVKVIDLKNKIGGREFLPQTQNLIKISENTFEDIAFTSLNAKTEGTSSIYSASLIPEDRETLVKQIYVYKNTEGFGRVILNGVSQKEKEDETETDIPALSADINFEIGKNNEEVVSDQSEIDSEEEVAF
jgi:hypothetical protein